MENNKQTMNNEIESIYKLSSDDACGIMNTRAEGLTASEVEDNRKKYGSNVISEKKGKPVILVFLSNFISLMAILLWAGGLIAFIADMPELGIAIWLVNIINGVFSFFQEYRAGKATEALKKMLPSYTRVVREDREQQVLSEDLVPGDIILLEEGDKISADARILESNDLQVNQSTLTGESNPVRKIHDPILREDLSRYEIPNLVFAGTSVASGTAKAVVIATGMKTEFGKIANLTQTMEEVKSPLEKELDRLTKQISIIAVSIGAVFFLAAVFFVKEPAADRYFIPGNGCTAHGEEPRACQTPFRR